MIVTDGGVLSPDEATYSVWHLFPASPVLLILFLCSCFNTIIHKGALTSDDVSYTKLYYFYDQLYICKVNATLIWNNFEWKKYILRDFHIM